MVKETGKEKTKEIAGASKEKSEVGITVKKEDNFSEWYTQVIQKAELADYTKVSGCIVFRPRAYAVWEKVQQYFDKKIKGLGIQNAYFPLFIPESLLKKESQHVEGFTPEVAWVTQAGETKLNERLAVRPTSETIMYDSYSNWIRSYKDLPLRINQWCSVVRWEFKHAVPFLRTREFLWQEGHTVFAAKEEAEKEVMQILSLYAEVLEELYAVPVLKGKKTDKEKFAGAVYTTSVESFMPTGKAIQGATSHFLGQNFSKAFDISFLNEKNEKDFGWQNSWGMSTRTIGMMIMMHSDNKGLVIPPRVASTHAVIVPILFEKTKEKVLAAAKKIKKELSTKYEVLLDDRDDYTPGWKFNEWEMKGVPVRVEIGPKDLEKGQAILVRRDNNEKLAVKIKDLPKELEGLLEKIQDNLYKKAKKFLHENIVKVKNWHEFVEAINSKKLVECYFCNDSECEDWIKDKTGGAKSINIPFEQPKDVSKHVCAHCGKEAKVLIYFAKSY